MDETKKNIAKAMFNDSACDNMIKWSEKDFIKSHPRLYKSIIESMVKALNYPN